MKTTSKYVAVFSTSRYGYGVLYRTVGTWYCTAHGQLQAVPLLERILSAAPFFKSPSWIGCACVVMTRASEKITVQCDVRRWFSNFAPGYVVFALRTADSGGLRIIRIKIMINGDGNARASDDECVSQTNHA